MGRYREDDRERGPSRAKMMERFAMVDRFIPFPEYDPYCKTMINAPDGGLADLIVELQGRRYVKLVAGQFQVRQRDGGLELVVEGAGLRLSHRVAPALLMEVAWQLRSTVGVEIDTDGWMPKRTRDG